MSKKQGKKKNNKKKKNKGIGKKILLFILLVVIAFAGWFAYRTYKNGGGVSGMLATAMGHDEYTKKNLKEIKVLLLGISTDLDSELTDTIMVASYNPNTQKANLLSIPRDTYTGKVPSTATASKKINALYNIEKTPDKTLAAVNELTGLDIQYYAVIKTEALIKLVDTIGGVEFDVPIDMVYDDPTQDLHINLKQGLQTLNGDKAEQLLRWRHSNPNKKGVMTTYPEEYGNNDFGRMRTQRDFIAATLRQTLKIGNIFRIGQILEIVHQNVTTNMELSFLKDYLPYVIEFDTENLKTAVIPGTTPNMNTTNGVSIFVMDKNASKELIDSMFNAPEEVVDPNTNTISNNVATPSTTATTNLASTTQKIKVELLDGNGDAAKIEKAKQALITAGFEVKNVGKSTPISKTIITNKKDTSDENLSKIKEILGVGSISTSKTAGSQVDVSIIIGKDY